jgi:hypothetical protein
MTVYQASVPPWRRNHSAAIPPQPRRRRKSQAGEWAVFLFFAAIFASLVHGAIR